LLLAVLLCAIPGSARAGALTRATLTELFPAPYLVGEREKDPPVWPIFKQGGPPTLSLDLVGYVFESIDLAPIPGFAGTPIDLLVAMTTDGEFLDVRVLSQHEPVFVGGIGPEPLLDFTSQYKGLKLKQNITVGSGTVRGTRTSGGANVYLDGIAKATASLRIINQSVLSAALRVARARLGYSGARDPALVARVRADLLEERTWAQMIGSGLVQRLSLKNRDVERAFAGTGGAGLDREAAAAPDEVFVDLYAALATIPTVGHGLLSDTGFSSMTARTNPGDHVLLVMSKGRYAFVGEDFVRNSVPDRLTLKQDGLAIEMRDLDLDARLRSIGQPAFDAWRAFRVIEQAGLDPGVPLELSLRVTRAHGLVYPERFSRDFTLDLAVPSRFLIPAAEDGKAWVGAWKGRFFDIGVLLLSLAGLTFALVRQSKVVSRVRYLRWFRPAFLAFTVAFIGWHAQGQLSIVNVVALLQAAIARRSLAFFLYDPMSTILWVFTLLTLLVWGRGTFCGWLCPFGALQDLAASAARIAGVRRWRARPRTDRWLKRLKHLVLLVVLAAALVSPRWSDLAVEVEPFKTAITLRLARPWPFSLYALGLVALGAVAYKGFCRYLCPLGAFLALAGRLRGFNWLARRAECGTPCQTCRYRCHYQAIDQAGRIEYSECFQCMDCVVIYNSDELCAPRILERKGRRMLPIVANRRH
jgi:transcriptional regulator of nitric oxide reductase